VSVDWEAEGLLAGVEGEARRDRIALLEDLYADGVSLDELRAAVAEDRLALLPVERILAGQGERYTAREVAERAGVDLERVHRLRRVLGLPVPDPDERVYSDEDVHAIERTRSFEEAGFTEEAQMEVSRVIGRAMAQVADAMREITQRTFVPPGSTERDVGLRYAEAARSTVPLMGPVLEYVLGVQLREQIRQDVVAATDLAHGPGTGSATVTVCFADLVGFTRLGEEVPVEQLGAVGRRLGDLAAEVVRPPVRLVKLIGDAAMLVSRETDPVLDAALALLEAADAAGDDFPQLRAGVARGDAIAHGGDWYGRPVNLASRVTQIARPASVLATGEVKEAARERAWRWSAAGRRRLKGIRGEVALFRVRRAPAGPEGVR
jgi:adenylate cyclase